MALDFAGRKLGPYLLGKKLGAGGMAAVYESYQATVKRKVAVKILPPHLMETPGYAERFSYEVELIAQLEHPHILPVYDYGTDQGISYVVMRLLTGGTLQEQLREKGALPLPEALAILKQIGGALDHAHQHGIVHRDLKPSNILFDPAGNAYLTDFGIAKLVQAESKGLTGTGQILGTPSYMAPEQWQAQAVDARTDIYALGILTYCTLTGQMPYEAPTPYALMHLHLNEIPLPLHHHLPYLPPSINAVVMKAMAKDKNQRFASVNEFVQALDQAIQQNATLEVEYPASTAQLFRETPITAPTADIEGATERLGTILEAPPQAEIAPSRWRVLVPLGAVLLIILLGAYFFLSQDDAAEIAEIVPTATQTNTASPTLTTTPTLTITPTYTYTATSTQPSATTPATEVAVAETTNEGGFLALANFDDPTLDGTVPFPLQLGYVFENPDETSATQQDGSFEVSVENLAEQGGVTVYIGSEMRLYEIGYFELDLRIKKQTGTNQGATLWIMPASDGEVPACQIDVPDGTNDPLLHCYGGVPGETLGTAIMAEKLPFSRDDWHKLRITIEPETALFSYYWDGELLGTYTPPEAREALLHGLQHWMLQSVINPFTLLEYSFDNITLATPDQLALELATSEVAPPTNIRYEQTFDNPASDGIVPYPVRTNILTGTNIDAPFEVVAAQEGGRFKVEVGTLQQGAEVETTLGYDLLFVEVAYFEFDFMVGAVEGDAGRVTLWVALSSNTDQPTCILIADPPTSDPALSCYGGIVTNTPIEQTSTAIFKDRLLARDTWYTLRVAIDPQSAVFSYYLDGELLGTFTPKNRRNVLSAGSDALHLSLVTAPFSLYTVYFDNMRIVGNQ